MSGIDAALEPDALAEVAEHALDALSARAPAGAGVVEAQVHVGGQRHALTRFANSRIHQNLESETVAVTLKVAVGGRVAAASTTRTDRDGLADLADRALSAAEVRPVDPHWPGVAGPTADSDDDTDDRSARDEARWDEARWDEAVAAATPAERAAAVAAFLAEGTAGQDGAGYCDTLAAAVAVATTGGRRARGRWTRSTVDGIFLTAPEGAHTPAGHGHRSSVRLADVTGAAGAAGATAARLGAASRGAVDLPPGEYPVVLMPECVAEVLAFLAGGFSAKAVQEGQSFAVPGAPLFDPALTFVDDATAPGAVGLGFDSEGTARRRVELILDGRCGGLLHDRRTAARAPLDGAAPSAVTSTSTSTGTPTGTSTGHGHLASDEWGPAPAALQLSPGPASPGAPQGDDPALVAGIERGVLVTCFNYCRVLDPKTVEVTGLTRNGTFWVVDGRVAHPVTNLRFTQSFVEALGPGRVEAVGGAARLADCEWGPGLVRTPALRLSAWRFTGGAAG